MRSDLVMSGHRRSPKYISISSISTCRTIPARLAQSVEHETLNLRVVGSSPTLGALLLCLESLKNVLVKMPRPGIEPGTFRSSV